MFGTWLSAIWLDRMESVEGTELAEPYSRKSGSNLELSRDKQFIHDQCAHKHAESDWDLQ